MKKIVFGVFMLTALAFSQMAQAQSYSWYPNCNVTKVGLYAIYATATGGAFTDRAFALPSTTTTKNQLMAMALTALSSGKQVTIQLPTGAAIGSTVNNMLILP